jgi:polar amino acid transport system permease protein
MKLDWSILWGEPGLLILKGLLVTLELSALVLVFATAIGLLLGTLRWMDMRATNPLCWLYVEFARNTPPVVQILFWYFSASFVLPGSVFRALRDMNYEFGAALAALSLYHGAFVGEVVRAGLGAVSRGQLDGARALGLSFGQSLKRILMPQALRIAIPPLGNEAVSIVKNTSLAMAIGVAEMTYQYKHIDNFAFRGTEALAVVTVLYVAICLAVSAFTTRLGHQLSRHVAAPAARPLATGE